MIYCYLQRVRQNDGREAESSADTLFLSLAAIEPFAFIALFLHLIKALAAVVKRAFVHYYAVEQRPYPSRPAKIAANLVGLFVAAYRNSRAASFAHD